jgi:hypothetical protein
VQSAERAGTLPNDRRTASATAATQNITTIPCSHAAPAVDKPIPFTTVSQAAKHDGHFGSNTSTAPGQDRRQQRWRAAGRGSAIGNANQDTDEIGRLYDQYRAALLLFASALAGDCGHFRSSSQSLHVRFHHVGDTADFRRLPEGRDTCLSATEGLSKSFECNIKPNFVPVFKAIRNCLR